MHIICKNTYKKNIAATSIIIVLLHFFSCRFPFAKPSDIIRDIPTFKNNTCTISGKVN